MAWITICTVAALPQAGELRELKAAGYVLCVANQDGRYAAVENACPHRGGPLAEGTLEGGKVLCPWHAWAFDLGTGAADHDPGQRVRVYALRVDGEQVMVEM